MDARKRMALVLSALLPGKGGSTAFAEVQYTARDKNGQIVKRGGRQRRMRNFLLSMDWNMRLTESIK